MKKVALVLLLLTTLFASDAKLASTIYARISKALSGVSEPKIYLHGEIEAFLKYPLANPVKSCMEADVIITTTMRSLPRECHEKTIFANNYRLLRSSPQIVGAFFWSKGRPNIVFYKERLNRHGITLSDEYERYIEE